MSTLIFIFTDLFEVNACEGFSTYGWITLFFIVDDCVLVQFEAAIAAAIAATLILPDNWLIAVIHCSQFSVAVFVAVSLQCDVVMFVVALTYGWFCCCCCCC
jgi:hypothetical protein